MTFYHLHIHMGFKGHRCTMKPQSTALPPPHRAWGRGGRYPFRRDAHEASATPWPARWTLASLFERLTPLGGIFMCSQAVPVLDPGSWHPPVTAGWCLTRQRSMGVGKQKMEPMACQCCRPRGACKELERGVPLPSKERG